MVQNIKTPIVIKKSSYYIVVKYGGKLITYKNNFLNKRKLFKVILGDKEGTLIYHIYIEIYCPGIISRIKK